ncbi:MAG: hypothetical protein UHX00_15560 [Caryophanon sp.]|nr:hypothetical protein [Caryophanon sp.]
MNRYIVWISIITIVLVMVTGKEVKASELVYAEKIWSIQMSQKTLNTEENLKNIYVLNDSNEKVDAEIKISEENAYIIEVNGIQFFDKGVYKLVIAKGLVAESGYPTIEEVIKDFKVEQNITTENIGGSWKSKYDHEDGMLNILVDFKENSTSMVIEQGIMTFVGESTYSIEQGQMNMEIQEANLKLNGLIKYYDANKFKIVSDTGKKAYFTKVR